MARGGDIHDELDVAQRQKYHQMMEFLKRRENANEWFSSTELDRKFLPTGARLARFPQSWLYAMIASHRGRYSRFRVRESQQDTATASTMRGGEGDYDDELLQFDICHVAPTFSTREDFLSLMRYPRDADTMLDTSATNECDMDDDEGGLGLLTSSLPTLDELRGRKQYGLVEDALCSGQVVQVACSQHYQSSTTAGAPHDSFGGSEDDGTTEALQHELDRECNEWWKASLWRLQCWHHTNRGVTEYLVDRLPSRMECNETATIMVSQRRRLASVAGDARQGDGSEASSTVTIDVAPALRTREEPSIHFIPFNSGAAERATRKRSEDVPPMEATAKQSHQFVASSRPTKGTLVVSSSSPSSKSALLRFCISHQQRPGQAPQIEKMSWNITITSKWVASVFGNSANSKNEYALFRRELVPPVATLPVAALLPCFRGERRKRSRDDEQSSKEDGEEYDECGVSSSLLAASSLKESWWANVAPVFRRTAHQTQPTQAEVNVMSSSFIASVNMHDAVSGVQLSTSSDTPRVRLEAAVRKRRRFRDLRNTHMIHFGLDLQQPFQPQLKYRPVPL